MREAFARVTRTGLALAIALRDRSRDRRMSSVDASRAAARRGAGSRDAARPVGPHRDDLAFELDGHAARRFASQGQLRAIVLAWKTAEIECLRDARRFPILLLDDVSSELDPARNAYLFEHLATCPASASSRPPTRAMSCSPKNAYRFPRQIAS